MSSDKPVIGFIGLGLMCHGMAKNIRAGGYDLWVRGRSNRAPVDSLLALGAQEAASPKQMAEKCDIIHICLSNSPQIEATMRGPGGILAGARPGLMVIETSTAIPASTEALAEELAAKGGYLVDAPLGGTPVQAEAGQLSAMLGCDKDILDRISPVIGCWAAKIIIARVQRDGAKASQHWPQNLFAPLIEVFSVGPNRHAEQAMPSPHSLCPNQQDSPDSEHFRRFCTDNYNISTGRTADRLSTFCTSCKDHILGCPTKGVKCSKGSTVRQLRVQHYN